MTGDHARRAPGSGPLVPGSARARALYRLLSGQDVVWLPRGDGADRFLPLVQLLVDVVSAGRQFKGVMLVERHESERATVRAMERHAVRLTTMGIDALAGVYSVLRLRPPNGFTTQVQIEADSNTGWISPMPLLILDPTTATIPSLCDDHLIGQLILLGRPWSSPVVHSGRVLGGRKANWGQVPPEVILAGAD